MKFSWHNAWALTLLGLWQCPAKSCSREQTTPVMGATTVDPMAPTAARTTVPEVALAPERGGGVRRFAIDVGDYTGLSDLTRDAEGHFWAVPERQRAFLRLELEGERPGMDDTPLPLQGVAEGMDTEAMVWLSDGRFALGTETQVGGRLSDAILLVTLSDGVAKVVEQINVPYNLWQLRARANDGIEGLCAVDDSLIFAVESVGRTPNGMRYAPLGRYHMQTRSWDAYGIVLSSRIGKISALTCRRGSPAPDAPTEVWAIERHFGVSRLLRVRLPAPGTTAAAPVTYLQPQVVIDFGKLIDAVPNLEGLAFGPRGDLYLLSDNDFGIVTGPTQVVVIPAHMLDAVPTAP